MDRQQKILSSLEGDSFKKHVADQPEQRLQIWIFISTNSRTPEELDRFQGCTFDTIARRRLVEDQDTILEFTGKIQELKKEVNCMDDSQDFQDAESVRSGFSQVDQCHSHLIQILVEC